MPELASPVASPPRPSEDVPPGRPVRPGRRHTVEEYLTFECDSPEKHEYYDGTIYAMTGASRSHALIVTRLVSAFDAMFRDRDCDVYSSGMRLKVSATGLYTYPDVMAVCGEVRIEVAGVPPAETLLNPQVVVEVLSHSTQSYDRGAKFDHVRQVESVTDYLLVSQDERHVERRSRQPDGTWLRSEFSGPDAVVPLPSIGCELPLAAVYRRIPINP